MRNLYRKSKNILFLGYGAEETILIGLLESRGCLVDHSTEKNIDPTNYSLIVSFGYRYILSEEFISKAPPIVNLHISFLPFNRGSHPNFWSHSEGSPSGVTIHLIDKGVDTGPYLFQKEVSIDKNKLTFRESRQILLNEIEALFIHNIDEILDLDFRLNYYSEIGTYHSSSELPQQVDWDNLIFDQLNKLEGEE